MLVEPFLEIDDVAHKYYNDGRELPSVTTILDRAGLISDFSKDDEARRRGALVHDFTANDDITRLDLRSVPSGLRGYVRAWRKFREQVGFIPILIEHRVDSVKYGYAGRFDRYGVRDGQPLRVLLDIKTSIAGVVPDYTRLQLAAYALAFNEKAVFERVAVALMPTGKFNVKTYPASQHFLDRAEWLGLLQK